MASILSMFNKRKPEKNDFAVFELTENDLMPVNYIEEAVIHSEKLIDDLRINKLKTTKLIQELKTSMIDAEEDLRQINICIKLQADVLHGLGKNLKDLPIFDEPKEEQE